MPVITISRGSFSGGKTLAECLAQKLGYRLVDRDVIVERAAALGASQDELRDALQKPPTFLERLQHRKYVYLTLIQAALCEEVRQGRAVYHGNAGHLLLKKAGPVLRTRIIAPVELRVAMCRKRLKLTREEALSHIHKMDNDRQKWTHYLYGVDWGDASLYDLVINLEHLTIEDACEAVCAVIRRQPCFEFGPKCRQAMDDLALACRVKAALALNSATSHLEFDVDSVRGKIAVRGKLSSSSEAQEVQRTAQRVEGVAEVSIEGLYAPPRV